MKKSIYTTLIMLMFVLSTFGQYNPYEARKLRYKEPVKIILLNMSSIAFEAIGDAKMDDGDKMMGHALQTASVGVLLTNAYVLDFDDYKWGYHLASYIFMRVAIFDPIYNLTRGLPIGYVGNTSAWDKSLQAINPPGGFGFIRRLSFTLAIAIPINEF